MPNHVTNEVIFSPLGPDEQDAILALVVRDGQIDFEVLVPAPLNIWMGSVGDKHSKTFPDTHLDWARRNWGTKWNAYRASIERDVDSVTLRFDTAWAPPYGWLVALFNSTKRGFQHNWLSEGDNQGHTGLWDWSKLEAFGGEAWAETLCDAEMQKHLHMLRLGVESFPEEDGDDTAGLPTSKATARQLRAESQ